MGKMGKLNGAKDRFKYVKDEYERFYTNLKGISEGFCKN